MNHSHIESPLNPRIYYYRIHRNSTLLKTNMGDPDFLGGKGKLYESVFRIVV